MRIPIEFLLSRNEPSGSGESAGKKDGLFMFHNFMEGNIVRSKKDGQIMTIRSVRRNPLDNTISDYVVCFWFNKQGEQVAKSFHVDDLEFVSEGNVKPYNLDENINPSIW